MYAEPWMNKTPVPRFTPLQIAEGDVRRWSARLLELDRELMQCERELRLARERVEKLR